MRHVDCPQSCRRLCTLGVLSAVLKHHACALSYMPALAWSTHRMRDSQGRLAVRTMQQIHATVLTHELDRGLRPRNSQG
jgi:hypothetical protein